jgi:hypothetical protein
MSGDEKMVCDFKSMRINSKGKGKGLGFGNGEGPIDKNFMDNFSNKKGYSNIDVILDNITKEQGTSVTDKIKRGVDK